MFLFLKKVFQNKNTYILLLLSFFSIALSIGRVMYTHTEFYLFLFWNLILAFIPWFVASIICLNDIRNKLSILLLVIVWILFFPNAPYILTDILHLGKGGLVPLWYDLILLLSYSFTGMLYGFISLYMIEEKLKSLMKWNIHAFVAVLLIYLSCFGIYLGRFLRWNSWDIFMNIPSLFSDVKQRLIYPLDYQATWGFTLLFGTLLNIMYFSYKVFDSDKGGKSRAAADKRKGS